MHELSLRKSPGNFGCVYLFQVSKNDDEECCFLKKFGFSMYNLHPYFVQWNLDLRKPDLRKNLDLRKIVGTTDFLVHKLFDLRKIF